MDYDLRWRFDFLGRASRYGMWNNPGDNDCDKAAFQNKEGLVRASVEGKHRRTFEIKPLAECDGWDFVNFEWMAACIAPALFKEEVAPNQHYLVGLKIKTREDEIEVYPTGTVNKVPRTAEDKSYHYATFGR